MTITREALEQLWEKLIQEIEQIFLDADHWNRCVRKDDEAEIDHDPDGELRVLLSRLKAQRTPRGGYAGEQQE